MRIKQCELLVELNNMNMIGQIVIGEGELDEAQCILVKN